MKILWVVLILTIISACTKRDNEVYRVESLIKSDTVGNYYKDCIGKVCSCHWGAGYSAYEVSCEFFNAVKENVK